MTKHEPIVYFIESDAGVVKIGYTTNIARRLSGLQTGHAEKLRLAAVISGGQSVEQEYHQRFAPHRHTGEWFDCADEIKAEIARIGMVEYPADETPKRPRGRPPGKDPRISITVKPELKAALEAMPGKVSENARMLLEQALGLA